MNEYHEIREHLEHKRRELVERVDGLKEAIRRENNPDFAEQATERENDEVLDALDDASRSEIAAIDRALARIERGEYGVCAHCGESIPEKRLEVLPYSVLCVQCAAKDGQQRTQ